MSLKLFSRSTLAAAIVVAGVSSPVSAWAQTTTLQPFPLGGRTSAATRLPNSVKSVKISVSYQFFLEGDTSTMEDQTNLADKGRKQLYRLLANECVVLKQTIADTCAIERANVNAQLRDSRRSQVGVRISGSATYNISLKPDSKEKN